MEKPTVAVRGRSNVSPIDPTLSDVRLVERTSISWRAVFAGVFVTFLCYMILMSLGLAVGGAGLRGVIQGGGSEALPIGAAIWMVLATLISLFVGCYLASRVSGMIAPRVGGVQGLVISALFFIFLLSQVGATLGALGRGIGGAIGAAGSAVSDLSGNPQVQDVVESALGGLNLKSPPDVVAKGIATRLVRGNNDAARNYLASQAGISSAQADARIAQIRTQLESTLKEVGGTVASALSIAGWSLFGALVLGSLAANLGGVAGARRNLTVDVVPERRQRVA